MIDSQGFIVDTAESTVEVPTGDNIAFLRITTECVTNKGTSYKRVQIYSIEEKQTSEIESKYEETPSKFKKFSELTPQCKRTHSHKRQKLK